MTPPAVKPTLAELGAQFIRFSAVGLANTAIHLAVVCSLVESSQAGPVGANAAAFCCANAFSFWANSRFTFGEQPVLARWWRFLFVSLFGLALAAGASAVAQRQGWHYLIGVALTFVAMPVISFAANRFWTWR